MVQVDYSLLTDNARRTVTKAFGVAKELRHTEICPQVMMASLVSEGKDMVFFLLQHMGVDRMRFTRAVSDSIPARRAREVHQIPLSDNLQQVLVRSLELASESGSVVAALEHIFWAFAVVEGPVKDMMLSLSITAAKVKEAVLAFRSGNINIPEMQTEEGEAHSHLKKYARNLTVLAQEGKLEPVVGRDEETRRVLQILSRKTKNNPILVGEPGTGKTAVVEGLAQRIARGDVPRDMEGLRIYALDVPSLIAGASHQGEFEDRLKSVIRETKEDPSIVLFIDEIHLLIGTGRGGGAMDAANILKPELARGEIKVIGATTTQEYTKYIESDKAFERRFQRVVVDEPDEDSTITIMRGIKQRFETYHRIKITDEAVISAVRLSKRYISDRFLPDKAIDLIDEAASRMRIERSSIPVEIDELRRQLRSKEMERESLRQDVQPHDLSALDVEIDNLREKENALNARWENERSLFEEVQQLRDAIQRRRVNYSQAESAGRYEEAVTIRAELNRLERQLAELSASGETTILKEALDEDDIRQVITLWTGIPVQKLRQAQTEKLAAIEETINRTVIGQDAAVSAVSKVIRRNKMGFGDAARPIGSFLFLGTTGVGKTELAKALADYLFNSRDMMVRIDMSEYQQEHTVSRLFGAPPGYVGYDQGGQLTEAVRHKPYSVVLLDEIEKAHPKVFETLLQVLDDGRMTDGHGRTVDFKNTIIILTSNVRMEELRRIMAPEFLNRIDDIVMFRPLDMQDIARICALQLDVLKEKLIGNGITLVSSGDVVPLLARKSYQPEYGARPVKRAINDYIINPLTMALLSKEVIRDRPVRVQTVGDRFVFVND